VGVAGQVSQHRLRPGEGRLGIDEPVLFAQRCQESSKGAGIAQAVVIAEELQVPGSMGLGELRQEEPPEQP
jgi:hypothetical protein